MQFGLEENIIAGINKIFEENAKIDKAIIFGSRAKGNYKAGSDIDIALKGQYLTFDDILKLHTKLDDLNLAYEIDLLNYDTIKEPALKEHIDRAGVEFYKRWKEYKLKQIGCTFLSGFAFKSQDYAAEGIPVIKIGNIQNKIVEIDPNGDFISKDVLTQKMSEYLLQDKDVLIAMTGQGSVGRVGRLKLRKTQEALLNQRVGKFLCDEKNLNIDYLYYILTTEKYQDYLFNTGSGSGQPNLSPDLILETEIPWTNYANQISISTVLNTLDDKIDLLQRQNKTLEQLAETLFRQWFVEEADESWEVGTVEAEFDFVMGQSPKGSTLNEDQNGMIFYQGRSDFGFRFPKERIYTTEPNRIAKKFDTLISVRAPVGDMNMAIEECCLGRGVAAFRYKQNNLFYSYTYYKMRSLMNQIKQFEDNGSVFGSIGKEDFKKLENIIPSSELIIKFQSEVKPIDDKIYSNTIQIKQLTQLKDTLLPKLMSGEVKVEMDK